MKHGVAASYFWGAFLEKGTDALEKIGVRRCLKTVYEQGIPQT